MIIPTDARRELYGLQIICEGFDKSYVDLIWSHRYPEPLAASTGKWPFRRVEHQPRKLRVAK